jgi:ribosomal protein L37AE/L43A
MYKVTHQLPNKGKMVCPTCTSTSFLLNYSKVVCRDCGWCAKGSAGNKYGAKKTIANDGIKRDSKLEASHADELLLRKQAGDILDYDSQYKVEIPIYNKEGKIIHIIKHKVDFRIHLKDGSYQLWESKGVETDDYKWRKKFLDLLWLQEHTDHTYLIVKQKR